MTRALSPIFAAALMAGLVLVPHAARADQIDGHWCDTDGRHLSIKGPTIVTPGGAEILGEYDRHGFAYVVPRGELGAGDKVLMLQRNHTTIHVWRSAPGKSDRGETETWRRCDPSTS